MRRLLATRDGNLVVWAVVWTVLWGYQAGALLVRPTLPSFGDALRDPALAGRAVAAPGRVGLVGLARLRARRLVSRGR
jgi:hypothetical protein